MKVKIEISICTGLMLNDHSNPYIESTTVLSDMCVCRSKVPCPLLNTSRLVKTGLKLA